MRPSSRCAYCGRSAASVDGNCPGCGAPLEPPAEYIDVTCLASTQREYVRISQPEVKE
jgi:predicted amidophosphoribosyltransferase